MSWVDEWDLAYGDGSGRCCLAGTLKSLRNILHHAASALCVVLSVGVHHLELALQLLWLVLHRGVDTGRRQHEGAGLCEVDRFRTRILQNVKRQSVGLSSCTQYDDDSKHI